MNKSLLVIVFVITVIGSLSCSKDKNLIGSDDNKYSVTGQIIKFRSDPLRKFPVHITGNDIDETILAEENGSYVITGLANGTGPLHLRSKGEGLRPEHAAAGIEPHRPQVPFQGCRIVMAREDHAPIGGRRHSRGNP